MFDNALAVEMGTKARQRVYVFIPTEWITTYYFAAVVYRNESARLAGVYSYENHDDL